MPGIWYKESKENGDAHALIVCGLLFPIWLLFQAQARDVNKSDFMSPSDCLENSSVQSDINHNFERASDY